MPKNWHCSSWANGQQPKGSKDKYRNKKYVEIYLRCNTAPPPLTPRTDLYLITLILSKIFILKQTVSSHSGLQTFCHEFAFGSHMPVLPPHSPIHLLHAKKCPSKIRMASLNRLRNNVLEWLTIVILLPKLLYSRSSLQEKSNSKPTAIDILSKKVERVEEQRFEQSVKWAWLETSPVTLNSFLERWSFSTLSLSFTDLGKSEYLGELRLQWNIHYW